MADGRRGRAEEVLAMTWDEALLTFGSLFLAALFAFYLDSLRERRATRRWVREYLGFWARTMAPFEDGRIAGQAMFARVDDAVQRWLATDRTGIEPDWDAIDGIDVSSSVSITPQLFGASLEAISPGLLALMFEVDSRAVVVQAQSAATLRLFETLLRPLVLRRAPLHADEERRAVELYRRDLAGLGQLVDAFGDQMVAVLNGLRAEGIAPDGG
jgi:hypothetical protein